MANCINVDGIIVEADGTISDILGMVGREDAPTVTTNSGEVITPDDYDRPAPPEGMQTNATPIKKGASYRERLLAVECALIARLFLSRFPGTRGSLEVKQNTLTIRSFPLPGDYTPNRVDLLIVTWGYPDLPPAGVHIPSGSPHRGQIASHLGGHVFAELPPSLQEHVEELTQYGWAWICYQYAKWSWRFNPKNLLAGDCLYKYTLNVYAALSGRHR